MNLPALEQPVKTTSATALPMDSGAAPACTVDAARFLRGGDRARARLDALAWKQNLPGKPSPAAGLSGEVLRRPGDELRQGWVQYLEQFPWEWFCTMTFAGFPHPEQADKAWRFLQCKVNRRLYGRNWYKNRKGLGWCRATEKQERGAIHFHALVLGAGDLRRLDVVDLWGEHFGFAKVEVPRRHECVRRYVSKYVLKEGDIELGGFLNQSALPLRFGQGVAVPLQG